MWKTKRLFDGFASILSNISAKISYSQTEYVNLFETQCDIAASDKPDALYIIR